MAIYRTGQASMDAQGYITGYDTKWREQLTLIRPGATIVFLTQPLQIAVITEVINDTSIRAITTGGAVVTRSNYAILLHDSITVDGLAQDVAETLRYYQSKETEIADAIEFFRDFDLDGLKDLVNQVKQGAESAKQSAAAAKTSETNSKASETNAANSASAAKTSETNAKTSETNAANSANKAKTEADRAAAAAESSEAQNRVPYAGVTLPAPTGVRDMLKRLRDTVKGGFWRVDDITQFPAGEMTPFRYGPGVCGGAGDTFFAFNVDYQNSRVKVFAGNNAAINGSSGNVGAIELAKLGANGDVAIGDGGTGASNDKGARTNLQAMHERIESLTIEDLNDIQGDKSGFYRQSVAANATTARNYPINTAGCLLVQRSGTTVPGSCIQTYTAFNNGRRWIRWLSNAATGAWSEWYELYNSGSSPVYNGYVRATTAGRTVEMFVGGSDVGIRNRTSQKALQLGDDGNFFYNSAYVMYDGVVKSGSDFNITANNIVIKTTSNGFKIRGTTNDISQALYLSAVQDNNTRLWYVGKRGNNSDILMHNDMLGSSVIVSSHIGLRTPSRNGKVFADGRALVVRSGNGREFSYENHQTAAQNASFILWGNNEAGRPTIIDCKLADGYVLFQAGQNADKSGTFNVNGVVQATAFNQTSDRDLKDNIEEIENATESLRKMSGYTYTLKENGLPYAGVIAQEVMEAIPEAVSGFTQYTDLEGPTKDGNQLVGEERFLSVDYGAVTGLLVKVCRESDDRISKLEKEVEYLKAAVAALINKPTTLDS